MASDENHRPCLPLKPQEKTVYRFTYIKLLVRNLNKQNLDWQVFSGLLPV